MSEDCDGRGVRSGGMKPVRLEQFLRCEIVQAASRADSSCVCGFMSRMQPPNNLTVVSSHRHLSTNTLRMSGGAPNKRLLFLCGDYMEDYEVMVPFQALKSYGIDCDTVCPGKKAGESCRTAIHDFEGDQTYSEKRGHNFVLNSDFDGVSVGRWGEGEPLWPSSRVLGPEREGEEGKAAAACLSTEGQGQVVSLVKDFASSNKLIASICHGQQVGA
eukprot:757991-Hanusia_phi.AAC.9